MPNSGFEAPVVGNGNFQYGPTGGSWTFANGGGISGMNSPFTGVPSAAPEGVQVAFIQATGTVSQSISGFQASSNYVITFKAIQRTNCCNTTGQDIGVYLDNTLLATFHPSNVGYVEYSTPTFATTTGAHTVKFAGLNGAASGDTAFIDNVRITGSPKPGYGLQWLVTDHLGTPRMVFDESGALANVKRHDYLPFGEELNMLQGLRTQASGFVSGDGVRQQFTAKERDGETGLDYFLARYYSSAGGRFTSPDPLLSSGQADHPQSWNRYAYCLNNPLLYIDPEGLKWYKPKGAQVNYAPFWSDTDPGDQYEEQTQMVYWGGAEHGWVALNPLKREFKDKFESRDAALQYVDPGQEVSQLDGISEMSMYLGAPGLLRGVLGIGVRLTARFFVQEAVEATAKTTAEGLSMEGLAFERKFLFKHLEGTSQAAKEASKGSAHVFDDLSTFSHVESEIFSRGTYTGTRDGFARWGLRFERPIGTRIASDGTRTPLQYGELKLRTDGSGLYHIIPRTGP